MIQLQCWWCLCRFCHCSLEGKDQRRDGEHCGDDLLGYGDDEVRVSHVWEERGGENESYDVKFSWIRACVKGRLPDHPDQQQVWYFIPKKQLGLQCSNPLKSSPVSHSLLVSDFVGIMSSCLNLAFPLSVSLTSLRLRYLCFSVSISIS